MEILKVEIGAFIYLPGIGNTIHVDMNPVFDGIESDTFYSTIYTSNLSWIWSYVDISYDTYAPNQWTWNDIKNLGINITSRGVAGTDFFYCAETVVRVTYKKINHIPSITIRNPHDLDKLNGLVNISGDSSDPDGVDDLDYIMINTPNNGWQYAIGTSNWIYVWNTTLVDDGEYSISAIAVDTHGRQSASHSIEVEVCNNHNLPTISIDNPSNRSEISNIIQINGTANDSDGNISFVELRFDNNYWIRANGTYNWFYNWDTTLTDNKEYCISARSFDGKSYSNISSIFVVVNNELNISFEKFNGGIGLTIDIINTGSIDAVQIPWSVSCNPSFIGFLISDNVSTGIIESLTSGESTTIQVNDFRGIGPTYIQILIGDVVASVSGFLLGPIMLRVREE